MSRFLMSSTSKPESEPSILSTSLTSLSVLHWTVLPRTQPQPVQVIGARVGVRGKVGHGASGGQRGSHSGEVGEPAVVAAVLVEGLVGGARLALERCNHWLDGGHLRSDVRSQVVQQGQRALGRLGLGHCAAGAFGLGGCPARREGARPLGERLLVLCVGIDVTAGQRHQLRFRGVEAGL
eukprot:scaffold57925_cov79-Phaeocystis_antarctica.AAC.1